MRPALLAAALAGGCTCAAMATAADTVSAPAPAIVIRNDAGLSAARIAQLQREFTDWGARVYRYLQVRDAAPVTLVLSRQAGPGLYVGDQILISPDDEHMLETWIHELAHHVTGHDSSFFFKEGIATHTLEEIFLEAGRVPQDWPQYGRSNDAWVSLFLDRGQLMPLADAMAWAQYDGRSRDGDFHSWQIYCIAGSFVGWYLRAHGHEAFRQAFADGQTAEPVADLERRWLDQIRAQKLPRFDPAQALPDRARYRAFVQRLRPR